MSLSDQTTGYAAAAPPAVPSYPIWRLSVAQYHDMIRVGILTDNDRVELLEGWLVPRMIKTPPHRSATFAVRQLLESAIPTGWYVDSEAPISLLLSEPEPDVVVVRGSSDDYQARHPVPSEVALVVEVCDATLRHDRTSKKRVYAEAAIPIYWIVNLVDRQVEVYTEPTGPAPEPGYRRTQIFGASDMVPWSVGEQTGRLPVEDLLR